MMFAASAGEVSDAAQPEFTIIPETTNDRYRVGRRSVADAPVPPAYQPRLQDCERKPKCQSRAVHLWPHRQRSDIKERAQMEGTP